MNREIHVRFREGVGVRFPRATRLVVMCRTKAACEEAERRVRVILGWLKLELHPQKTRKVDLSHGSEGLDFLGCHLRKRMSGPILEREGRRVYFLHRWPSAKSMKRVRQKVREATDRRWSGVKDVRTLIARLNPVLRGWGAYFSTGNAAKRFNQLDTYVWQRLRTFLVRRKGRNLRPGQTDQWDRNFFHSHGLYRLRGTVKYPEAA